MKIRTSILLPFWLVLMTTAVYGQGATVISDSRHLAIINENAAVRYAAETTHNSYLGKINQKLDDIKINITSVILVQDMIYRSLAEVNGILRTGLTAGQIGGMASEIIRECELMIQTAKGSPHLLLFAEDVAAHMKSRGVSLAMEVSDFILKEGSDILMDYEKRDALLRKVVLELRVMRALAFSMHRSMERAKILGMLRMLNPYQGFVNRDTRLADDIIYKIKIIKE
ncbi:MULTISPECIES: hypothetical protein [Sphingobacterium]|jgi:hypothetical protein|uniref:hypothetical protein n=1 Tax=Sphingobacterium TaxID=28453 RepID=UPI00095EB956|nr:MULTISPECIES: hypothetical protein [Sphingobacterium]OJY99731.1 MAG: hypothetical protein BGP15_20810 [Sphingobacterium sp. 40-24]